MSIDYAITANDADFQKKIKNVRNSISNTSKEIEKEGGSWDKMFSNMGKTIASAFTFAAAGQLVNQIARVRGEFQQLEIAFGTMLQNEEMAAKLMSDVTQFAATTPFDLQGVANGTKQLLAFGSTSAEVIDELRMLGDIAAGLSLPLGDLIYLYGTTRTQGQLFTMDLRQFQGRGIPLADELAKIFGVTKKEVSELVSEGKVGFPIVLQALKNMTSEGGKFGGLMEKQSKSITGQLSNLGDAIDQMFNEIGKSNEGIIGTAIESASLLVENYEKVGKILLELVALYGAYKTALFVITLATKEQTLATLAQQKAQLLLNNTFLKNPYTLAAAAVATLCVGIWKLIDANRQVTIEQKAQESHNKVIEQQAELYRTLDEEVRKHLSTLQDEYSSQNAKREALAYLNEHYPELIQKYYDEKTAIIDLNGALEEYNRLKSEQIAQNNRERLSHLQELKTEYTNNPFNLAFQGWTKEEMKLYKGREGQRTLDAEIALAQAEVDKDIFNAWQRGIKDLTDKQIEVQIDEILRRNAAVRNKEIEITEKEQSELNKKLGLLQAEKQLRAQQKEQNTPTIDKDALKDYKKADDKAYKKVRDEEMDFLIDQEKNEFTKIDLQVQKSLIALGDELMAYREIYEAAGQDTEQLDELYARLVEIEKKKGELAKQELIDNKMKEKTEKLKEAMEANQSIELQIEAINKKYDEQIALLNEAGKAEHASQAEKNRNAEVEELRLKQKDFYIKMFSDINQLSTQSLKKIIEDARKYLKTEGAKKLDPEEIKEFQEQLLNIEEEVALNRSKKINFGASWDNIAKKAMKYQYVLEQINKTQDEGEKKTLEEAKNVLKDDIAKDLKGLGVNALVSGLGKAANLMRDLADASGDVSFENAAEAMETISNMASSIAQGAASGGIYGALIGGISSILEFFTSKIIDMATRSKKALYQLEEDLEEYSKSLKINSLKISEDEYDSIFGVNSLERARHAYKLAQESLKEYSEYLKKYSREDIEAFRSVIKDGENVSYEQLEQFASLFGVQEGKNKLQSMLVTTTGKNKKGKKEVVATTLEEVAPEIFNDDGTLNIKNAEEFLKTNERISEESRKQIQYAIDLQKAYEENMSILEEQAETFMGSFASSITDVIWDAVMNGADAWEEFENVGSEIISSLGKQFMQEFLITTYLEQYKDKMVEAFGADDGGASIQNVISDIFAGFPTMLEAGSEMAEQWKKYAEEQGIDLSSGGSGTSGSSGGFTTMSQETGDELNGRFTHIQIKTTEIANRLATFEQYHSQVQGLLLMIHNNLYTLANNSELLKTIDSKLNDIKNNTANI